MKYDPSCCSILVVDDDEVMRELLSAIFETEGHTVYTVGSGTEALDWLKTAGNNVDILLVDLKMPGLEGSELAVRLNEMRGPETLLIGMSGSEPKAGVRAAFDAFLQKPFGLEAFGEAVERGAKVRADRTGARAAETAQQRSAPPARSSAAKGGCGQTTATAVLDEAVYGQLAALLPAEQLRELYRTAIADVLRRVELMRAAAAKGNFEQCRREAHAIKGSCSMVGAAELSALAAGVEKGSFGGTPPLADFTAACSRLRRILDARL